MVILQKVDRTYNCRSIIVEESGKIKGESNRNLGRYFIEGLKRVADEIHKYDSSLFNTNSLMQDLEII